MSKATTLILGGLAVAGIALGGAGLGLAYLNQPRKQVQGTLEQANLTEIAGTTVDPNAGDLAVPITHAMQDGNTDVRWFCGKAGTAKPYEGTWDQLGGALAFNPGKQSLVALQLTFLLDSFIGAGAEHAAPDALTNTIRDSWFNVDEHPVATFTVSAATPKQDADEAALPENTADGWTHLVTGDFALNGVTKQLSIPVKIAMSEQSFSLDADFTINRRDYNVDGDASGSIVDDQVRITVAIAATTGVDALTQKLADQLNRQSDIIARQRMIVTQLEAEVAYLREREAQIGPRVNTLWQTAELDSDDALPEKFTDRIQYPNGRRASFDMILVPGDPARGIEPYYMGKTEVTWNMIETWSYSHDIDPGLSARLQTVGLRPSPLYSGAVPLEIGLGQQPALGMSRTTAQAYCQWLSEQTGRTYRLPTEAEWELAVQLGGGIPEDPDAFVQQAHFIESAGPYVDPNAPYSAFDEIDEEEESEKPLAARTVGRGEPNALGIYDLVGNAAEWVIPANPTVRKVRGGHFMMPAAEYTHDWEAIENQDEWNASLPQKPPSKFWYKDFYYTGFRLVCEPVNVPE